MKNIPTFEDFINENLRPDQIEQISKDLAYSMPNHTTPDSKGKFSAEQVQKAFKYIPDFKYIKDKKVIQTIIDKVLDIVNESAIDEALAAATPSKLEVREPLTKAVQIKLMGDARKGILKMMSASNGESHFWNPKTKEYIAFTKTYGGKGEYWHSAAIDGGGNLMEGVNEERVYGMFNDSQGKPSKLSQEILDICLKALPKYLIDNIESVEAAGYSTTSLVSPPTVSNKGQSMGFNEYTTITLIFKKPMGKSKTTELQVGLRKRTSGPGTGYLAVKPTADGHYVLPEQSAAIEFYDAAPERLSDLYKSKLEKLMK
jgi:hypothetical protein